MDQELRNSPPAPLAPVAFDISKPFETALDNGLRVVIVESKRLPIVSFRLSFHSGDIDDPQGNIGLTSAMTNLMTEGTDNYTSLQLAEKVERLGASLSANSSYDFTTVAASSLSFYASSMLDMMAEITLRPTFPENEVDLYRRNTVEHLKFQRSQPPFLAAEQAARAIYGDHPYARVSPTPADIEKITTAALKKFRQQRLIPNNAIFMVVGDVDRDEILGQIKERFGDWETGSKPEPVNVELPSANGSRCIVVDRSGSAQSNIVIANRATARLTADYFPILVMNQVLGAGASSRVFMNLREEKGYTYGAYTRLDLKRLAGDFEATAEVRNDVTGESLKEFFYELERIRTDLVGDEELADAKNFLTGVFPIRAETQEGLTNLLLNQKLYGLDEDYLQAYRSNVNAVTAEQVLDAAKKYVRPDEASIIIVGDAEAVVPAAAEYAPSVEIYDTEGSMRTDN